MDHGVVLDGSRDDVVARRPERSGHAFDRRVVRLGAAASEHHLARPRV